MPKYEIRPGLTHTTIPGHGAVMPGDVIEGDFDHFVPGKLRRAVSKAVAAPPPPKPAAPPPPPPAPEPEPEPEEDEALTDEETAEQIPDFEDPEPGVVEDDDTPSMEWKKAELVAYAEELEIDTFGNKTEILERIEEFLR